MDILEINAKERYVRVEPMVTIGRLMEALVERGWMVPIVPEIGEDFFFKSKLVAWDIAFWLILPGDLTIGGLVMGGGIESTSHKYGIWQHICLR